VHQAPTNDRKTAPDDITTIRNIARVPDAVKEMPLPARQKDITQAVGLNKGTVSRALKQLGDSGVLVRNADGALDTATGHTLLHLTVDAGKDGEGWEALPRTVESGPGPGATIHGSGPDRIPNWCPRGPPAKIRPSSTRRAARGSAVPVGNPAGQRDRRPKNRLPGASRSEE
jgi:hypothetical protein